MLESLIEEQSSHRNEKDEEINIYKNNKSNQYIDRIQNKSLNYLSKNKLNKSCSKYWNTEFIEILSDREINQS